MESNQTPEQKTTDSAEWQQDLINRLAFSALNEQRRTRRWGIFFKFLMFTYLVAILFIYSPDISVDPGANARHTALVEIKGVIGPEAEVIRKMGDKTQARDTMRKAGIPITPGSIGNVANLDEALSIASDIG